jgi:hypothetical protein
VRDEVFCLWRYRERIAELEARKRQKCEGWKQTEYSSDAQRGPGWVRELVDQNCYSHERDDHDEDNAAARVHGLLPRDRSAGGE